MQVSNQPVIQKQHVNLPSLSAEVVDLQKIAQSLRDKLTVSVADLDLAKRQAGYHMSNHRDDGLPSASDRVGDLTEALPTDVKALNDLIERMTNIQPVMDRQIKMARAEKANHTCFVR